MNNYYNRIFLHDLSLYNNTPSNYIQVKVIAKFLIKSLNDNNQTISYFYSLIVQLLIVFVYKLVNEIRQSQFFFHF